VPNTTTVINYTINPSYTYNGCSYLAGRKSGSFLNVFSSQNAAKYVAAPGTAALVNYSGYTSFAATAKSRPPMLMFTNTDGFLYAINASTGALLWGWTPRSVLAQMQYYSSFQGVQAMNGGFAVYDAKDASGNWASYVVGSAQSGAEHFSVKLSNAGLPTTVVYDTVVSGGSAPGDKVPTTVGAAPSRQPPQVVYINGSTYYVYVVNTGSSTVTSTLYELNVATGVVTSAVLPATLSSAIFVDAQNNELWWGTSGGLVYHGVLTGAASSDVGNMTQVGSTLNPANNTGLVTPVVYVGATEYQGIPYFYATNAAQITLFDIETAGWIPLWAATPSSGYTYKNSLFSINAAVSAMTTGSVISDFPLIVDQSLTLPVYVPAASTCSLGTGYYDFYNLRSGKFPTLPFSSNGVAITKNISAGVGPAFTPNIQVTATGFNLFGGSQGQTTPNSPLAGKGQRALGPVSWRQR